MLVVTCFTLYNGQNGVGICSLYESIITIIFYNLLSGADIGFSERGANHTGSLKQGVWRAQPPRSYRIFCFMKYKNAT